MWTQTNEVLTLLPYQVEDVERHLQRGGLLNISETGAGKTVVTLEALAQLQPRSVLIVCPGQAVRVWTDRCTKWHNMTVTLYSGTPGKRALIRRQFDAQPTQILVCTNRMLKEVLAWRNAWEIIVADEVEQMGLLDRGNKIFELLDKAVRKHCIPITATPIRRTFADLWTLLHLVAPRQFPHYWPWVTKHAIFIPSTFQKKAFLERAKDPEAFWAEISPYIIRRIKRDVNSQLPPFSRRPYPVEMTPAQEKAYNTLVQDLWLETEDRLTVAQNSLVLQTRLRQLLTCPRILGIDEHGGAIEALLTLCDPLFFKQQPVFVATPYREAIPHIATALFDRFPRLQIELIHGGMQEDAKTVADRFMSGTGARVLIATIKSSASWDAHCAAEGFFVGCSYSAVENEQVEGRIDRTGQQNDAVRMTYLLCSGTVDDRVLEILNAKTYARNWTIDIPSMLQETRRLAGQVKK